MTVTQIIALVRDLMILILLGVILWVVYRAGENHDLKNQVTALQRAVEANAQTEAQWTKEARDAEVKRQTESAAILAVVGKHSDPIRLCNKDSSSGMSKGAAASPGDLATAGTNDGGSGKDIRPAVTAFEIKYEGYLAACRSILAGWPH